MARCTAIRLLHLGHKSAQVAEIQAVSIPTVYAWINRWRKGRIEALVIAREIGDRRGESNHSWNLALALEKLGELPRAADLMQFTVDYEREIGHPDAEEDAASLAELRSRLSSSGGQ